MVDAEGKISERENVELPEGDVEMESIAGGDMGDDEEVATEVAPLKVPQVLDTVIDCLSKFARKGVTRSELTDAKSCAVGRAILGTESCFDLADFACDEILTHGSVVHPEEIVASLQAVTLDRLNGVIRDVFDISRCKIAVVGGLPSRLESPL
jgi:predicted Zn-dependent peptidase